MIIVTNKSQVVRSSRELPKNAFFFWVRLSFVCTCRCVSECGNRIKSRIYETKRVEFLFLIGMTEWNNSKEFPKPYYTLIEARRLICYL